MKPPSNRRERVMSERAKKIADEMVQDPLFYQLCRNQASSEKQLFGIAEQFRDLFAEVIARHLTELAEEQAKALVEKYERYKGSVDDKSGFFISLVAYNGSCKPLVDQLTAALLKSMEVKDV